MLKISDCWCRSLMNKINLLSLKSQQLCHYFRKENVNEGLENLILMVQNHCNFGTLRLIFNINQYLYLRIYLIFVQW